MSQPSLRSQGLIQVRRALRREICCYRSYNEISGGRFL